MKNLLIPFDFSDVSMNALEYAMRFAARCEKATLNLLYISDSKMEKDKEKELKSNFEELLRKYQGAGEPPISYHFRTGNFTDAIIDIHKSLDIDLVIMGTSGAEEGVESPVTRTSRFVLEADLPVLVVPVSNKYFKLDKILLALGEDVMHDTSTLNLLLDVSSRSKAEVDVLTVSRNPESAGYSEADEKNENTLQYYLEMFYSHHSFAENEDILKGIDDYIKKHDVDLLAIMPKTHATTGSPSKGKLTREVTLKSEIPVLVLD
ncbi:universal stress protein [Salegentibacter flavus]|uniref:Nucleotide-binding universal stress protein, UspA family n=1 Tax=Salegentibacter flavus TaxID=287099 RepID=A0A1I5B160_9FLAO|nr:universal stress protein [Salegentibacter flavus]SFN68427.1 Nucleotide-binding universal stress protein, UspA family [Salegentibacter flavus]